MGKATSKLRLRKRELAKLSQSKYMKNDIEEEKITEEEHQKRITKLKECGILK